MTDAPTPNPTTTNTQDPAQRRGFTTSEFWLSTIATVAGILLASGALPEGGTAAQITGGILAVLASLGYTASRTSLKKQDRT